MKTLVLSSNCSGGGKTTVTLGLMKALINRGYKVQGFKSGPDYIDSKFHEEITRQTSRNLDFFLMGEEGVKESFNKGNGDLAIVEGVMGLYDGKGITEEYSTYHLAKTLDGAPIVLVITPKAQSLTFIAELKGIQTFKKANIKGVILNKISKSYYILLKEIIEKNSDIKVLGFIPQDERIALKSRHLGLVQSEEVEDLNGKIEICAKLIEENIDLDFLLNSFKDVSFEKKELFEVKNKGLKIGVAKDKAFSFYYKENIEILEALGEVIYFSPLKDRELPRGLDFLYLGGGYPEVFKAELSKNTTMRKSIREALEKGLNCYAECGGFMYLTREIEGTKMVGFFDGKSYMTNKLNNFGYATLKYQDVEINCHEFHKSKTDMDIEPVYEISKEGYTGKIKKWNCGYKKKNTIAGYPHIHFFSNMEFLNKILGNEESR